MSFRCLHDRNEIKTRLDRNRNLFLYSIGDLDDMFWPRTGWYGLDLDGRLEEVVCIYAGPEIPTLLALTDCGASAGGMENLLADILYLLPAHFHAHLSPGLEQVFSGKYTAAEAEPHYRMVLPDKTAAGGMGLADAAGPEAVRLGTGDIKEMLELYSDSYPENWFNPGILETNVYYGIRDNGLLISIAGTHIYSPAFGIAAVGNVSTRPEYRGKGLGTEVTAALCSKLAAEGLQIGLNVKTANAPAIRCYEKLGFKKTDTFGEYLFSLKPGALG